VSPNPDWTIVGVVLLARVDPDRAPPSRFA
jgi:hypothetical protein